MSDLRQKTVRDWCIGSLVGAAVGDAMGLSYEGLTRQRAARMLGKPERYRLFFGRGMVSDDAEHACMVAQALLASGGEVALFQKDLAKRLRFWLLGVPAGVGFATLRAILRLWMGVSPERSGVYSAGNGPAMRAATLGASIEDLTQLREFVRASTRLTHTDPKAEWGAFAVALAAHQAARFPQRTGAEFLAQLRFCLGAEASELLVAIERAALSAERGQSTQDFAIEFGLSNGVSGYVMHTVPIALHAWLRHPNDFRAAVLAVIECGGDADSTAAIVGGVLGVAAGVEGVPLEWRSGLLEWSRNVAWMQRLGGAITSPLTKTSPPAIPLVLALPRNLFFLCVILFHGLRRLFPPY